MSSVVKMLWNLHTRISDLVSSYSLLKELLLNALC